MPKQTPNDNSVPVKASYGHAFILFAVLVIILLAAAALRLSFVPETFGQLGFYRAAAIDDARSFTPRHVGIEICEMCHEEKVALHNKDVHISVQCETCHGPAWEHVDDPEKTLVPIPNRRESCLTCHRALTARPGDFPQITWLEHYKFVGVEDRTTSCTSCHNPHEPLFMDRDISTARLHPAIHRCRDCHIGRTDQNQVRPPGHPAIFECGYCHSETVKDFSSRSHSEVNCTTCHLYFKETEFSGRIIRDSDPRFCLLCHRAADFRSAGAPPGIEWPDHLDDVSMGPEDAKKRCIDCHRDRIHGRIRRTSR